MFTTKSDQDNVINIVSEVFKYILLNFQGNTLKTL